jgi:hypothetical protein
MGSYTFRDRSQTKREPAYEPTFGSDNKRPARPGAASGVAAVVGVAGSSAPEDHVGLVNAATMADPLYLKRISCMWQVEGVRKAVEGQIVNRRIRCVCDT